MLIHPLFTTRAPLVLASSSPRRQQMLRTMGLDFTVAPAEVDETPLPGETPQSFASRMAGAKARAVAGSHPDAWVLGADTVVTREGVILGKPRDRAEALAILQHLAGRTHQVLSAICLCSLAQGIERTEVDTTGVTFISAADQLLSAYIATGEPLDKAGAYGIQGRAGAFIRRVEGSYTGIMGLPLFETAELLSRSGIRI